MFNLAGTRITYGRGAVIVDGLYSSEDRELVRQEVPCRHFVDVNTHYYYYSTKVDQ